MGLTEDKERLKEKDRKMKAREREKNKETAEEREKGKDRNFYIRMLYTLFNFYLVLYDPGHAG